MMSEVILLPKNKTFLEDIYVKKTYDSYAALLCGRDGCCGCHPGLWHTSKPGFYHPLDLIVPRFASLDDEIYDEGRA